MQNNDFFKKNASEYLKNFIFLCDLQNLPAFIPLPDLSFKSTLKHFIDSHGVLRFVRAENFRKACAEELFSEEHLAWISEQEDCAELIQSYIDYVFELVPGPLQYECAGLLLRTSLNDGQKKLLELICSYLTTLAS